MLLKRIQTITEKQHDTEVLEMAAKTLEYLCTEGFAIYTRCDVQRSTLIDSIVNKYKEAMDEWNSLIEGVSICIHGQAECIVCIRRSALV